jgi:hypothetical protein
MAVAQSRSADAAGRLLRTAVIVSLVIHLAAYGGWKWGQTQAWWKTAGLPAWLEILPHKPGFPLLVRQFANVQQPKQPPPLLYVDVDPALAAPQPPPNPKYYSVEDTVASNPEKKVPSDKPDIKGVQDKVMQTVPNGVRSAPLQPSPPVQPKTETAENQAAEKQASPKPAYTPGDLADAKPAPKMQENKGTSDMTIATSETPKVTSQTPNGTEDVTEPKHERPRTLAEARERSGAPGERTRQEGGVNKVAINDPTVDAIRTEYGDYDREFVDTVDAWWKHLLKDRQNLVAGTVVLEFNLHSDGRVTDVNPVSSDVDELQTLMCKQAVLDPARYKPWPAKMRAVLSDPRQVRFTFYYYN